MAIRDRLKKTFGGKKKKDGSNSSGGSSNGSDPTYYTGRKDIEYYKPHEIPRSKYRGRVDPEHKERLDAYSFADAFTHIRRRSSQAFSGMMSPGGTKSQSRRTSYMSHMSRDGPISRGTAVTPTPHDVANPVSRRPTLTGQQPAPLIRENSRDDTDLSNTGLSRTVTAKQGQENVPTLGLEGEATPGKRESDSTTPANNPVYDQPFTVAELEKAMTRATLKGAEDHTVPSAVPIVAH